MAAAQEIIACGRSWLGTRFQHQGRLKKTERHSGGVDCLGLLIGIARELELKDAAGNPLWLHDDIVYTHTPDSALLMARLKQILQPVTHSAMRAGDIVLLRIDGQPQHLGLITEYEMEGDSAYGLLHAYAQARKVVEHALDEVWQKRIVQVYRLHVGSWKLL